MSTDSAVIRNTFAVGPESWCSYEYNASIVAKDEIFILTTWSPTGGPGNAGYVWADETRWSADIPESPISILALITYRRWANLGPIDLRGAKGSVYLRGDGLQLHGAKCFFWANRLGERWHLTSQPLEISAGGWADGPQRFSLPNDESAWHRSWAPHTPKSLDGTLANAISYGFAFVGYARSVSGRLSMAQFELSPAAVAPRTESRALNVAVLGASDKPERYSHKAILLLREKGHTPYPVHPALKTIEGIPVFASLGGIPDAIDTISVYLSPANQARVEDEILRSGARRVIFNPGAENEPLAARLRAAGIGVENACTLVLLRTGQF